MSNSENPYRDRKQGEMGFGDTSIKTDVEGSPKKLSEKADGWKSNSFDQSLLNGSGVSGNDYCYPDELNDDSGPAWPSNSAK